MLSNLPKHAAEQPTGEDELKLAPPSEKSAEEWRRELAGPPKLPLADSDRSKVKRPIRWQFSVRELVWLTTLICLTLSAYRFLPFAFFTATTGFFALCLLFNTRLLPEESHRRLVWISLGVVSAAYFICCIATLFYYAP
ncbi:MAG: hypothetical protein NXI22_18665 [bacterium]|nr:hypothetical protein [bacterium]